MNKQTEALKLALEALRDYRRSDDDRVSVAMGILQEALAEQPAQQQDSETITQTFTGLPKRKLCDLLQAGWQINGVCFQRTEEDGTVRRGAATTGGMVLWWNVEQPAQQRPQNCGTSFCSCIECVMEPAQQQEPVALETVYETIIHWDEGGGKRSRRELAQRIVDLYTSPPESKPRVGLTDWEREKLRSEADEADAGYTQLIKATEAKLREKNA